MTLPRVPRRGRRRRINDRNKVLLVLLGAGVALAALGLSLLLVLGAVLQPNSSNVGAEGSTPNRGTLRSALGNLLFGAAPPPTQTIPRFPGETSRDPVAQMTALVHLMEAIRDETSLQELEPRILELFGEMLRAEADGLRVAPHNRREVEQALPQFDQRMVAANERLEIIPGGRELRRKLVKLLEETPPAAAPLDEPAGAAQRTQPAGQDESGPLPTIASWVVWGWATPPPPEPPEDRQRRRKGVEAAGRNPDVMRVYVRGVTSDSMIDRLRRKVLDATHGIVVAPVMAGEVREFRCGKIKDFRHATYRLDVGPIVKIEPEKAILHVQLDPSELFVRPREWVDGPIPPLDFEKAGIPAASSVPLPDPPEPADVRERREDVRWDAGQNLEGVEVVLHGSNKALNRRVFLRLKDMRLAKSLRTANAGFLPAAIHCDDIGDMRAFTGKLDLGTMIRYDDRNGVIHLVVDPARFAAPQAPESTTPRVASVPKPPEPADVRARRQDARSRAGLDPDEVDLTFPGLTDEQAKDMPQRLLAAKVGKQVTSRRSGDGPWRFQVRDVDDMRRLAEKLDLGTIVEYDEEQGRIVVQPDPAKLAAPVPPLTPPTVPPSGSRGRFNPRSPPRGLPFPR